jgi:uncharacterized protein with HEPN domain
MKAGPQADKVYLAHMLECIERVQAYCEEGESRFRTSRLIQDAVIRNLQTMAESSQRLTDATKALAPTVPWRAIAGFRNIIVHDYLGVDIDLVWHVVESDLPKLRQGLIYASAALSNQSES